MQGLSLYIKNLSWVFAEKVVRIVSSFITNILIINYIGAEILGKISFAQAIVAFFMGIAFLGLKDLITSKLIQEKEDSSLIISTAFFLRLLSGFICSLILIIIALIFFSDDEFIFYSVVILSVALVFQSFSVVEAYFQANKLQKLAATALFIQNFFVSLIKILFIYLTINVQYVLLIYFTESILIAFIYFYFSKKLHLGLSPKNFSIKLAQNLIKLGIPLILSSITVSIYMNIDMVMLTSILGPSSTGIYAAATTITGLFYFIPSILIATAFPAISAYNNQSKIQNERMSVLLRVSILFGFTFSIFVYLFSVPIISFLYDSEFAKSSEILQIHIFCFPFVFMNMLTSMYLISHNLTNEVFKRSFIGMILNVVLNFIFIQAYNAWGAAFASLITHIIISLFFDLFHKKTKKLFFTKISFLNPKNIKKDISYIFNNLGINIRALNFYKAYSFTKKYKTLPSLIKFNKFFHQLPQTKFISSKWFLNITDHKDKYQSSSSSSINLNIHKLKRHQKIYVCTDALENFALNYLEKIDTPFMLLSGDSDLSLRPDSFNQNIIKMIVDNPNLSIWYAQNLEYSHPKLKYLPIGMDYHTAYENPKFFGSKKMLPLEQEKEILEISNNADFISNKELKIYSNWHFFMDRGDRRECFESIDKQICFYEPKRVKRSTSYINQSNYAFVSSPAGEGFDCHRTFEAILLGSIPIVKSNPISHMFKDLPVCIVDEWSDVSKEFLSETLDVYLRKKFDYKLIFNDYWKNILAFEKDAKESKHIFTMRQFRDFINENIKR
jgi:O-antigen/teichoic acid export membrane protein